ncbi:MAG TPA: hypothetical protein PK616_08040, partial [Fibrobacteraceae bacterium]|nr:hypothetical protein [Fibrobacteraceae bacterium]
RPWYFFGEQNFLFTTKMISPLLKGIAPNSEFIPIVDNKAEEARFTHSEAKITKAFDSCEVCWPDVLDSNDFAARRAFKNFTISKEPKNNYLKTRLMAHLNDTAFV